MWSNSHTPTQHECDEEEDRKDAGEQDYFPQTAKIQVPVGMLRQRNTKSHVKPQISTLSAAVAIEGKRR